jgi:molecular chaperone GrpE (heat shock protein)
LARAHDFGADTVSRGESELRLTRISAKLATMNDMTNWKVPKWPFFLADALLFGFAYFFILHAPHAIHYWELAAACVALGAILSLIPFYLDYRAMGKILEISALGEVGDKMQNLETLSAQIGSATSHWAIIQETVQTEAGKTTTAARQIAEQMAAEARQFSEFMQKMSDSEKATLRLEVEKLRRAEGEWLQILVRILDHVFALHTAAVRTGDPKFAEPITNFQNACRGTVRRIGLTPFIAEPDEKFNAERHQLAGDKEKPPQGAVVAETIGTGYTFQGKLLRPALVRLREANAAKPIERSAPVEQLAHENVGEELPL